MKQHETGRAPLTMDDSFRNGMAVITVATNRYLGYWQAMSVSADRFLMPDVPLTFYVFTDQPEAARESERSLIRSRVIPIEVPPLGWPEATLMRYELFERSWNLISEGLVMHLDADMHVAASPSFQPQPSAWANGLAFVRHPGYRRPSARRMVNLYAKSPKLLKGDLQLRLRLGGLGAWETSQASLAYVPRRHRQTYVCGGTWMGLKKPLGEMIRMLASRTRQDLERGIIAKWHDESHLNWYASYHDHYQFESDKCYAPGYPQLRDLSPEILAVDKGENRTR